MNPEEVQKEENTELPEIKNGNPEDILILAEELEIEGYSGWKQKTIQLLKQFIAGTVPDVRGMGASDAVFMLENAGLQVKIKGTGKVKIQSLNPGVKYRRGQLVNLTLG